MFGAEPQEKWTAEEKAEFEAHVADQIRQMTRTAVIATMIFLATILAIVPFSAGHALHSHGETIGKYLVLLAMAELLWFVLRWGFVYNAWQTAREIRRDTADAD